MRQSTRSFVDRIDFRTSPGNLGGAENVGADPARAGLARAAARRWSSRTSGSTTSTRRARCASTSCTRAPRSTRSARRSAGSRTSPPTLAPTPAPTAEELRLIRDELDPEGDVHEVAGSRRPDRDRARRVSSTAPAEDVRRPHHHDRAPGMADHVVGDAAQEESPDRAALVGAHHDQVRVLGGGGLDDRLAGVAIPGHAGGVGARRPARAGRRAPRARTRPDSDLGRPGAGGDRR